ncbi:MAG: polysaccharide deacetylase family protein [Thermoflavifilum sp.]|uniref:polysaccharide deacetylase family protein n=1 Tax=Thermoflavifilum sp. TaxID=1968839 RepID=UPI0018A43605|nr:polysaccharide deacetylase family protein [Thermoflavifilum sp.]QOR76466.1 MAG: polysaccharide deacetylase family protein [Thermoflavifilum sp.]
MNYWTRTPRWMKALFPAFVWEKQDVNPAVYLTFDDGPHPEITPSVLEQLRHHHAHATFFCIGHRVVQYPDIYQQIFIEQHGIGNHTYDHLDGWKVPSHKYVDNVMLAAVHINSHLFRPPYGHITPWLYRKIKQNIPEMQVVMWDVLSGDFDTSLSPQSCLEIVLFKARPGSIIVFHDSEKARPRMEYALPRVLAYFEKKGWEMKALPYQKISH